MGTVGGMWDEPGEWGWAVKEGHLTVLALLS